MASSWDFKLDKVSGIHGGHEDAVKRISKRVLHDGDVSFLRWKAPYVFYLAVSSNPAIHVLPFGYIFVELNMPDKTAHIRSIAVEECFQKQGIGTSMMKTVLRELDMRGIMTCTLYVSPTFGAKDNKPAIARKFYSKFGFEDTREKTPHGSEIWSRTASPFVKGKEFAYSSDDDELSKK